MSDSPTAGRVRTSGSHSFSFLKDFIYLFTRDAEREAETQAEGEASPCREPDVGLDPRTPGSRPEPKADTQTLMHP